MLNAASFVSFFAQTALVSLAFGTELSCSPPMKKMQLTAEGSVYSTFRFCTDLTADDSDEENICDSDDGTEDIIEENIRLLEYHWCLL